MRVVPKASIARKGAKNINHHMLYITFPFLPYRERSFSSLIKHRFLFSMMYVAYGEGLAKGDLMSRYVSLKAKSLRSFGIRQLTAEAEERRPFLLTAGIRLNKNVIN